MPIYNYTTKSSDGRTVKGMMEADKESRVIDNLRKQNLIIISIQERKKVKKQEGSNKKIKSDDLVIFSRQLATMVDSGIPLVQSLDILTEQLEGKGLKVVIDQVRDSVETGSSLSEALAKHPKVFSALFINMVMAGEKSGMLDDILDRLAGYLEKADALRRKVTSSLIYPVVVISMSILITLVLILKVIPTFKGIFATLGGDLPLPTRILIMISDGMLQFFPFIIIVLVLIFIGFKKYINTEKGRFRFDLTLLKLPVFGPLFRKVAVAQFSRTFSTLIKSGVPVLDSLEIIGKTSGNKVIEKATNEVRLSIGEGESIADPLARSGVFPPMVVRMIAVGEQTGELEKMLTKIADFYDEQVDNAVSGLTSMIEPLVIALLGIIIGGIVMAMFLPIFKLTEMI